MLTIRKYSELIINLLFYGILFLLIIFLPSFVWDGLIDPTQTGKFIAFSYAVILFFLLFILRQVMFKKEEAVKFNIIDVLLAILLLYITINRYFIQPVYGFSMNYMELLGLAALYIILRSLKKEVYPYLFLAVIVSGIIQAVYGNLQLWSYYPSHHSGFKMTGSFFNPGPYAGFLAVVFPVALGMYLFRDRFQSPKINVLHKVLNNPLAKRLFFEYLPLAGIISILLVVPASRSRAAWLAVLASVVFFIVIRYRSKIKLFFNTPLKKAVTLSVLIFFITGGSAGLYFFKKDSADGRILIWKTTANMIKDHPFSGVGFDRFSAHYMDYQAKYFKENPESAYVMTAGDVNYAFNEPLSFTAETGLPGLAILLLIIFVLARGFDKDNVIQVICWATLLAGATFSLFSYPAEILSIKMTLILILAFLVSTSTYKSYAIRWGQFENRALLYSVKGSAVVCLLAVILLSVHLNKLTRGFKNWQNAYTTYQFGAYEASLEGYESIYTLFEQNGEFLQYYGKALSMTEKHEEAILILEKAKKYNSTTVTQTALGDSYTAIGDFQKAEEAYVQAWNMIPSRFYPKYLLAKMYEKSGKDDAAIETACELMEKEIKINSTAIREIKSEMSVLLKKYRKSSS